MSQNISAFILAGGKSSRMGEDKGLISLDGKPVISYVIDELRKLTDDISILTSHENYRQFGHPLINDFYKDKGPAAGIDAALHHAKHDVIFITGCDMPFINEAAINKLTGYSLQHEICVVSDGSFIEPLFAVYKRHCKQKWRTLLLQGTLKLSDYFFHFDTNFAPAETFLLSDPHLFLNLNTPADLEIAEKWINR